MQVKPDTAVAPALKALLENLIDYAGVFPPAALTLQVAVDNYMKYSESAHSWMLHWFVIDSANLDNLPESLDGRLSLLGDQDEPRAATIESKKVLKAAHPVYCEIGITDLSALDAVKEGGCFAKFRAGGVKPEAIPAVKEVTSFILACAEKRLSFKATAGLHHPIRSEHALTYESGAPRAVMHGFVNILMAAAFAWSGEHAIEEIIAETDASAFQFDQRAHWRDRCLSTEQIHDARHNFVHSIGSCSFEEPVADLRSLGLLT